MRGTVGLDQLYEKYHQDVKFIMVYIREAHPVDGWWFGKGLIGAALRLSRIKVALDVVDPTTIEERRKVAGQCKRALQYGIHTYVDEMDDAANKAYAAWPTRLYLVGRDRKVVYAGGPGPFGFHPAELGKAIEAYLA